MERKKVKVFLDSNVIISGLLSEKSYPRMTLDLCCLDLETVQFFTGKYNLIEIERTLKKKLPEALSVYQKYLPILKLSVIPLSEKKHVVKFTKIISPEDAPVLASAIESGMNYLVTGDKKHFTPVKEKKTYPVRIISPSEFINEILPEILSHGLP